MTYLWHRAAVVLCLVGIVVTSIYDDIIYPLDDGVISIGMVFLFVITLGTLIARLNRDERQRRQRNAGPREPGEAG